MKPRVLGVHPVGRSSAPHLERNQRIALAWIGHIDPALRDNR